MFAQPQIAGDLFVLKKVIGRVLREMDMIWLKTRKARSLPRGFYVLDCEVLCRSHHSG